LLKGIVELDSASLERYLQPVHNFVILLIRSFH